MSKNIALLGSTGSIGTQTLDVIEGLGLTVYGLSAFNEVEQVFSQIEKYKPQIVCLHVPEAAKELAAKVDIPVLSGMDGTLEITAAPDVDIVVNAISGASGLMPGLKAIEHKKRLASANKECFVMAGHLFQGNNEIIPVDSEHSALFQGILSGRYSDVSRLILTASGGPFFRGSTDLTKVTVADALRHPNWSMGPRITIDSATMFNKGLEIIEARWLFDIQPEQINVLIHPQSIVHSVVEFVDGTQMAQMSLPDMRLPIQYALTYPERKPSPVEKLDLAKFRSLEFFDVPFERFPALEQAIRALNIGGISPTIANAADEIAVARFLREEIRFIDIPVIIEKCLDRYADSTSPDLDTIINADRDCRQFAAALST